MVPVDQEQLRLLQLHRHRGHSDRMSCHQSGTGLVYLVVFCDGFVVFYMQLGCVVGFERFGVVVLCCIALCCLSICFGVVVCIDWLFNRECFVVDMACFIVCLVADIDGFILCCRDWAWVWMSKREADKVVGKQIGLKRAEFG